MRRTTERSYRVSRPIVENGYRSSHFAEWTSQYCHQAHRVQIERRSSEVDIELRTTLRVSYTCASPHSILDLDPRYRTVNVNMLVHFSHAGSFECLPNNVESPHLWIRLLSQIFKRFRVSTRINASCTLSHRPKPFAHRKTCTDPWRWYSLNSPYFRPIGFNILFRNMTATETCMSISLVPEPNRKFWTIKVLRRFRNNEMVSSLVSYYYFVNQGSIIIIFISGTIQNLHSALVPI